MGYGWDTLPEHLRTRVEGLQARHGFDQAYPNRGGDENVIDSYYEEPHSTVTPVVHHHPRTGRTLLYVSQQATIEILGLSKEENEELLEVLFDHLYNSPGVLRHEWQQGDLVVWDNRLLQHARGTVDLEGPARTLRKVVGPMFFSEADRVRPTFSKVAPADSCRPPAGVQTTGRPVRRCGLPGNHKSRSGSHDAATVDVERVAGEVVGAVRGKEHGEGAGVVLRVS